MLCRKSITALTAAATLTLAGFGFAQENTHTGQNPQEPPRAVPPADRPTTPGSGGATIDSRTTGQRGANAGDAAASAAGAADEAKAVQQIRGLANDPMASDKLFVMGAAMGNQWEVAFNTLVAERAETKEIKDHAKMIAQDHQQAQQKLEAIAQKNNVMLSSGLPAEKQAKLEVFRAMPADKLETCWLTAMRAGHAKDIVSYSDHSKTLQNEELRGYVNEVLPKLRQHGTEVNRIAATKGFTNDAMNSGAKAPTMQQ